MGAGGGGCCFYAKDPNDFCGTCPHIDRSTYNSVQSHCESSNGHWCPGNARLYEQVAVDAEPHSAMLSRPSRTTAMVASVAALLGMAALFVFSRRYNNATRFLQRSGASNYGHLHHGQLENAEGTA